MKINRAVALAISMLDGLTGSVKDVTTPHWGSIGARQNPICGLRWLRALVTTEAESRDKRRMALGAVGQA